MADTYAKILIHCVFSTKNRIPHITEALWSYLRGIARNRGVNALAVGGTLNHGHLLLALPTGLTVSNLMRDLKANSSRHLNEKRRGFAWQDGYGAFAVSKSGLPALTAYVEGQREHHRKTTFKEEFVKLLRLHEIEYNDKYLWD